MSAAGERAVKAGQGDRTNAAASPPALPAAGR
jgi:hypothetical protein